MKTITIIDLFNKMAKGEEVPKKFKYGDNIYYLQDGIGFDYCYRCDEIDDIFESSFTFEILNDEIEIIEDTLKEEKKMPKKLDIRQEKNCKNNWKWKVYGKEHSYNISTPQKIIADKVNEICDYLESKGK